MVAEPALTWLQWVLDVEHGGPVAVQHVLLHLVFGHVAATVFYPDARLQVVEVAAVELEELDEQNSNVGVGAGHVLPIVHLQQKMSHITNFKKVTINSFVRFLLINCIQLNKTQETFHIFYAFSVFSASLS